MTNAQKAQTLSVLFGTEAVSGIMVALEQGTDKIKKNTEALKNNQGYARKSAEYMANTLQGQILATASKQEALSLKIGETFAPAKLELVKTYNDLLDYMLDKTEKNAETLNRIPNFLTGTLEIAKDIVKVIGEIKDYLKSIPVVKLAKFVGEKTTSKALKFVTGGYAVDYIAERGKKKSEQNKLELEKQEKSLENIKEFKPKSNLKENFIESGINRYNEFSPTYSFGDTNITISVPDGTNINNTNEISNIFKKVVRDELELRDKRLMNQIDPRRR